MNPRPHESSYHLKYMLWALLIEESECPAPLLVTKQIIHFETGYVLYLGIIYSKK
jgi:hypothetical protein